MSTKEDIRLLFKDLFTQTEIRMIAKRLEIVRRLLKQESYENIQKELKVTSGTINAIGNILKLRGDGFRKVCLKLDGLEEKYIKQQREITKNLENPFRKKTQRKTLLGEVIKAGISALDKKIIQTQKHNSAKKVLPS
jgi:uncharacterized protein YerC